MAKAKTNSQLEQRRERWRRFDAKHVERRLLKLARKRARKHGLPFDITEADIHIPANCPVDGLPIELSDGRGRKGYRARSPSLDQKRPREGYTNDNIQVMSMIWNRRKCDMTTDDVRTLLRFMEGPASDFPVHCALSFGA